MQIFRLVVPGVLFLVAFELILAGQPRQEADAPTGTVKLHVVGVDGKPVAHAAVEVGSTREQLGTQKAPSPVSAQTDDQGVAQFDWPVGNLQFKVEVKGHGYGITGLVEVVSGKTADVSFPALAPYATISGTIPDGKNATVQLREAYSFKPIVIPADARGHFSAEVHAGAWWVTVRRDKAEIARTPNAIVLHAGEVASDVSLRAPDVQDRIAATRPTVTGRPEQAVKVISWVHGRVRDAAGHPVAGATVYAAVVYFGGMRMYEKAAEAMTDDAGHYDIEGDSGLSNASATLVAYKKGHPPEMAWITLPQVPWMQFQDGKRPVVPPPPPSAPIDFVLAGQGGKLDVVAMQEEKSAVGATVELFRQGGNLRDIWAAPSHDQAQQDVEAIAYPRTTVGADGVAHFEDLPPGRYQIIAATNENDVTMLRGGFPESARSAIGTADSVAIRPGQRTVQHLLIYPQPNEVALKITRQDGGPLVGQVGMSTGSVNGSAGWNSGIKLDENGIGVRNFQSIGLWRVGVQYTDAPIAYIPLPEPYYSADAVVAVSARLGDAIPVPATAMKMEPGSVAVDLRDATGKPARGIVTIGPEVGEPTMVGSTDTAGHVRFDHVPSWNYYVKARLNGQGAGDLEITDWTPLPTTNQLEGKMFVPPVQITLSPNKKLQITLAAQPAGYVRGVLKTPAGRAAHEYAVYLDPSDDNQGAAIDYDRATGDFVAGPFLPGKKHLRVVSPLRDGPQPSAAEQEFTIEPGKVVAMIATAPPPRAPATRPAVAPNGGSVMIGAGGLQSQGAGGELLAGHVYQADGKTPAYGAMLLYFVPDDIQPHLAAMTDVTGAIHGRDLWYRGNPQPTEPLGSPPGPVIVAVLPGTCGASIVDAAAGLDSPRSISLPPPIAWHGTVTLGGKKLTGQTGQFRILAEYQGKGKLDGVLSVWATPQADGSFELPGLTPGGYRVQASLDGIWLSDTVTLSAGGKTPPAPIHLNIGEPGGPAMIHCLSAKGKPLCGISVIMDRPAGPLTDLDWPAEFTSDGAGDVWIPALEAGKHTVHFKDGTGTVDFAVPALPAKMAVEVRLTAHSNE